MEITPCFQYHPEKVEESIRVFDLFHRSGIKIVYALKSNTFEPFVRRLLAAGYGFDVASANEFRTVQWIGGDMWNVSFSAPSILPGELVKAAELGVQFYAFDSQQELEIIMRTVHHPRLLARISVQNSGGGQNLSETFGMTPAYFLRILRIMIANGYPVPGLTFHVGSQNTSLFAWQQALDQMDSLVTQACRLGANITCLNAGGGIPAPYTAGVTVGDLHCIPNAGAYTFVCENFHMRPYPPIIQAEEVSA